jgi:hypothetical protein
MRLFRQRRDQRARARQRLVEVIHAKEQQQAVARFRAVGIGEERVRMVTPPMQAKQHGAVGFKRAEIIMGRPGGGQTQ